MSKEVEKKIVEMTFDNTQFERGVKQTMSTIDEFNEKLAFNNSTDGIERIQRSFDGLNMRGAISGLDNFTVRFSGLSVMIDRIIENITDDVYKAIGNISTAIDKVFNQIKTGGETRALNIEQAKFQLSGLGVAWNDIKDDINYAVKDTAYGLDAAAKAASQLVASNVQLGEEMRYSLRGISGLAAMTNSSYEDIARIFTKVAGQGRLMGDDLNSVAARGINVAAELGKVFNTTEADIRDMVSKGVIDFKTFAKAMDDAFGQHAKDANKTYAGSLSNVKAALNRLGADVATAKFEALRDIFNELIPKIDQFKQDFKPAEDAIKRIINVIKNLTQNLIQRVDISKIAKKVSDGVVKIVNAIEYLIDQFDRAIELVKRVENIEAFKKLEDDAKKTNYAIKGVIDALDGVSEKTKENIDNAKEENKELQAAKDIVNGRYGILNGQDRIDYIKDVLNLDPETVQDYINQVFDEGKKWDEVVLRAGDNASKANSKYEKLSNTIKNIVKTFASLKHILKNIFESIKNVATVMIDSFKNTFNLDVKNTIGDIPKTMSDISDKFKITEERAERLRPVFNTLFSILKFIVETIDKLIEHIKDGITWIQNNETIKNIATSIKDLFKAIFDNIKKLKDHIVESDAFKKIVENIKPVMSSIGDFITYILDGITNIIARATEAITNLGNGASFFDVISEFLFGTYEKRTALYSIIKGGFIVGFIGLIAKAIFKMRLFMNDGIFYIFKFLGVLSNLSRVLFTYRYYLRANAFAAIAKGIGIIVLSLVGLAYYINKNGSESIIEAALIISAMVGGMLAIMYSISKIEGVKMNFGGFIKASIVVRSLGLAIISIAGALYFVASAINNFGLDSVIGSLGVIVVAMVSLVGVMFVLSKMNTTLVSQTVSSTQTTRSLERVGRVLLAMSISMLIISKAITSLLLVVKENNLSNNDIWVKGILPIVSLMGAMTLFVAVLQKLTIADVGKRSLIKVAGVILSLAIGVSIVSKALVSMMSITSEMSNNDIWVKGILPIVSLMGAMVTAILLLSIKSTSLNTVTDNFGRRNKLKSSSLQRVASILLSLSIGIFIISKALTSLLKVVKENNISTQELWFTGVLPILTLILTIFGGLAIFGKIVDAKSNFFTPGKYASLALVIVGVAGSISLILLSLSHLLKVMKKNNVSSSELWNTVGATILIFGAIIAGFIAIATLVKGLKILTISAGLLLITTTLVTVMAGLGLITTFFDMNKLWEAVGIMGALIAMISILGMSFGTSAAPGLLALAGGILSLSLSLITFSVAAGLAGVAMILLGVALPILATGVKDTVLILVDGIIAVIDRIPDLADSLVYAIGSLAYDVGKVVFVLIGNLIMGIVDGIREMLDSHSPSRVFAEIGSDCVLGFFIGILETLGEVGQRIIDAFDNYIVAPICDFFGIHSPSTLFEGFGGDMIDGLNLGIQNGLSDLDTEGFSNDFSTLLPNMNEIGYNSGEDFTSGLTEGLDITSLGDKLGMDLSGAIVETAEEEGRKIDWTQIYHLEDLINDPTKYDYLKSVGEQQLTAAYEDWQRHAEFMANNPTYKAYLDNIETNFGADFAERYREIQASGNDAMKEELDKYLLGTYIDQTKLDKATFDLMSKVKTSLDGSTEKVFSDRHYANIAHVVSEQLKVKDKFEDDARNARNEARMKLIMSVEDDEGNILTNGVQSFLKDGTSYLNVDYDNSSVKTNMDAVSSDISSAVNAQGDKLAQKLEYINNRVNEFDTNQMNRTNSLLSRMSQMEDAISRIQVYLDTGALVGQLVDPMDDALGGKSRRKARG